MVSEFNAPSANEPKTGSIDTTIASSDRNPWVSTLIRIGNVVFIVLGINYTNSINTGNFARVPEGFRPKNSVKCALSIKTTANVILFADAAIGVNGYISQYAANNVKQLHVIGVYQV